MKGQREVTTEHHRNGRLQAQEANRVVNARLFSYLNEPCTFSGNEPNFGEFLEQPAFPAKPGLPSLIVAVSQVCQTDRSPRRIPPALFVKSHQAHRDASLISFLSWTFPFTHFYRHLTGSCSVYHSEIKKVSPKCDFMLLNRVSSVEMRHRSERVSYKCVWWLRWILCSLFNPISEGFCTVSKFPPSFRTQLTDKATQS